MADLAWSFDDRVDEEVTILRAKAHEAMSTPFRLALVALSTNDDLELDGLVGTAARFSVTFGDGTSRVYRGVCDHLECVHAVSAGASTYTLGLVHYLGMLAHRVDHRIFQGMTTREIVSSVLTEWDIDAEWSLRDTHPRFDHRTQLGESDYDFVARLLAEDGISYFYRDDDGTSRLVLSDAPEAIERRGAPITYVDGAGHDAMPRSASRVRRSAATRPESVVVSDFDFRRPHYALRGGSGAASARRRDVHRFRVGGSAVRTASADPSTPQADARGAVRADEELLAASAQRELTRERAERRVVQLLTNAPEVRPGATIEIVGHPRADFDGRLLVTSATMSWSESEVAHVAVRAGFADDGYEPAAVPKPRIVGVQTALVTGPAGEEIHTDELGRVSIHFPWDRGGPTDERSSCWVRVSQGWAGAGYGLFAIPRIGHEVLVAFLDGDPDLPVVVGSLHDGANRVPHRLPENKTVSAFRTASSPGGEGWNELRFDDRLGSEHVLLRAERDLATTAESTYSVRVGRDWSSVVGGSRTRVVEGTDTTTIAGSSTCSVNGNLSCSVLGRSSLFTGGARDERVVGSRSVRVEGVDVRRVDASESAVIAFDQSVTVGRHQTVVVGSGARGQGASASSFVHGHQTLAATKGIVLTSDTEITLVCGESRVEIRPDKIVVRSTSVELAAGSELRARGEAGALVLTKNAELAAEEVKLYSKGASVELDADASVNGSKVRLARKNGSKSSAESDDATDETVALKVRVTSPDGAAYGGKTYRLLVAGRKFDGTTRADGGVEEQVPQSAQTAHLTVWLDVYPTGRTLVWHIAIGEVAAASTVRGATARLANMGYRRGASEEADAETRAALRAYQAAHGLALSGELDGPTIARLSEDHGS